MGIRVGHGRHGPRDAVAPGYGRASRPSAVKSREDRRQRHATGAGNRDRHHHDGTGRAPRATAAGRRSGISRAWLAARPSGQGRGRREAVERAGSAGGTGAPSQPGQRGGPCRSMAHNCAIMPLVARNRPRDWGGGGAGRATSSPATPLCFDRWPMHQQQRQRLFSEVLLAVAAGCQLAQISQHGCGPPQVSSISRTAGPCPPPDWPMRMTSHLVRMKREQIRAGCLAAPCDSASLRNRA
jgi:hypothetical protein